MTEETIIFCGDSNDTTSPQNFISFFMRSMIAAGCNDDTKMARNFKYYLRTGSEADEWYQNLGALEQNSWCLLEAEFNRQWEPVAIVKKTQQEKEQELSKCKLEMDELGKTIKVGGLDTYTHVAWAAKVLRLAKDAQVEKTNNLIWFVRDNLPSVLKDLVPATHNTWFDFTKAITDVPLEKLKEKAEKERKSQEDSNKLKIRLQQLERQVATQRTAPVDDLVAQVQRMTIGNNTNQSRAPVAPAQRAPVTPTPITHNPLNPIRNIRYVRQQPRTQQQQRQPLTGEARQLMIARTTLLPQHEDTPSGRIAYDAQVREWLATHGDVRVTEHTPYPLRPGTGMVCSGECFRCGGHEHLSRDCVVPDESKLPQKETLWRSICFTTLGSMNRNAPRVMVVFADEEESQGNGEGL
ncbi:hypothetical protein BJ138DRAFT_1018215 [Hygrophoropsis aurantiaca]|uniref:Uncharacterized protein n=1 Tax=Hygrophoropsis aurantiaca TaxID=72124 RepID=A0ACB7ZW25_9AGAM|nr:hypothetical protein BJ138DRAFT_1018215 [Hygrophoropsis aurantiaca]